MTPILLAALLVVLPQERRDELELDRVQLADGSVESGQVAYHGADRLALRQGSHVRWFERSQVASVDARIHALDELLDRVDALGAPTPGGLLELSRFAAHSRLPGEARLLALDALLADRDDQEAAELAGARWRRDRWEVELGERAGLDALLEGDRPWKDRIALDTAHYHVETNLPLDQAIDATIDLERLRRAFFAVFGHEIPLLDPREIMHVHLHADRASFPQPGSGRASSFTPEDRIARVLVELPPWRPRLVHEGVRQLLYYTSRREPKARGEVPVWFDVGLAEAFGLGTSGPLGASRFDPSRVDRTHLRTHLRAERPLALERLLVLEPIDLDDHDDQRLKYAQSYTLAHWLLFGDDQDLRAAFIGYLRDAWDGRTGPSHLRKTLGLDYDELGERWIAHVTALAGP